MPSPDSHHEAEDGVVQGAGWIERPPIATPPRADDLAIVLEGGGARAAYQVGLLKGLLRHRPNVRLPLITGVSAGAINACFLAAHPGSLAEAVDELIGLWSGLTVEQVFRADMRSLALHAWHWGAGLLSGGRIVRPPFVGLVNTAPLRRTLVSALRPREDGVIEGIERSLECGRITGLALVTSSYTTGRTVAWVQGRQMEDWDRAFRVSRPSRLTVDHVMASAALPFFFPAVSLDGHWYGDGGMRLVTPLSPAVHLGARRILAFSTRYGRRHDPEPPETRRYPTPAQIAGQLLDAIFLDDLDQDARHLARLNLLLQDLPDEKRRGLRVIDLVFIRPSQDVGRLATEYEARLPRPLRHLLEGAGARRTSGTGLLSFVMFQPDYLKRLIEIGEADFAARAADVDALLDGRA